MRFGVMIHKGHRDTRRTRSPSSANAVNVILRMRREIKVVIQNTRGVRSGVFTPDMAFERIVKERIEELLTAPLNLVDNVTNEILESSKLCSQVANILLKVIKNF